MIFKKSYIIIALAIFLNLLNAQDRYESFPTWIKSIPDYGFTGMKYSVTQKSNLLILGTAGFGALIANRFDDQIQNYTQQHGLLPDQVSRFGDLYGVIGSGILLPLSIIITSKATDDSNREMKEKLEFAASALVANGVTTVILKKLIGRERPNGLNNHSMPSGHTSQSFAVAAVVNEIYGQNAGIIAYLIASLVGISRINDNDHYLSDVIIGAGIGTAIGTGFAKTYKENIYIPNISINLTFNL
jgi:membrane-associated phospholipid phosphatase